MLKYVPSAIAPLALVLAAGLVQAQVAPLRITQVYGGGGGTGATYGRDFVEIYNYGPSPIDMSKFAVQYAATAGTSWTSKTLSGTAMPGQFFLVSMSTTLSPAGALDLSPDFQVTTSTAMAAAAGKVALTTVGALGTTACPAGSNVIDIAGYGAGTTCFEGTGPTGSISITTSATRTNVCADTNDNASDFTVVAPDPRNSSTAQPGCSLLAGSDLMVVGAVASACGVQTGETLIYTYSIINVGGDPATDVVLTLDLPTGPVNFASSVPALTPAGNQLIWNAGTVTVGTQVILSVYLTATGPGRVFAGPAAVTASNEIATYNNAMDAIPATVVFSAAPANVAKGVFNTRPGVSSDLDPVNAPGVKISGTLNRIYWSADRSRWITVVDTDADTGTNDEALLVGNGDTWTVPVREGITNMPSTNLPLFDFGLYQGINNAGHWAFSGDDNPSTTAATPDQIVVKDTGSGITLVAAEGQAVPSIPGATYGTTNGSVTMQTDGTCSFYFSLTGPATTADTAIFKNDGNTKLGQEGTDAPTNQVDANNTPTSFTYKAFDTGSGDNFGFFVSADGLNWQSSCTINASTTLPASSGCDRVLVEDGAVVIQENITFAPLAPATAENASPIAYTYMDASGDSYVYGNLNGGQDFATRNGVVIAKTDDPISGGLTWDDASFADTFFMAVGNTAGDHVVGGFTSAGDTSIDAVLVYNGTQIIAREGDPIDLNGDGLLNDDAYIRVFRNDYATLTNDGVFYFAVETQTAATRCVLGTVTTGQALLRIDLGGGNPCPGNECGGQDYNGDGDFGTDQDIEAFFACLGGNCCPTCFCQGSDFNGDGDFGTDADIEAFFRVLGGGNC